MTHTLSTGEESAHRSQDMRTGLSVGGSSNVLVDTNQLPGMRTTLARKLQGKDPPCHSLRPLRRISSLRARQVKSSDMLRE